MNQIESDDKKKIFKRENGQEYVRDIVNPGEAVIVLPIDKEGNVIFELQLREAVGEVSLELPAGMIDKDEIPEVAAKRELMEETGYIAEKIEHLKSVHTSSGYSSEKIHIYLATDLKEGNQKLDDDEEILEIKKIHINECIELVDKNFFSHASENLAILTYYYKYLR